ncbi:MAG TPA: UDP-N-acetylmuramoylalanyl-D-glutamyl-2,6-diaminopimelate--D-alanyl-D-alanine ligase [Xanthobacteraceae bacterium]|jgi:UDP-N-acetylmuramoyl-tripeptide--D-alanyl-D-alanine ligase|nr:UDP-N-acetylmuramoylalanyl-D-glutamyl-2,6-diaminopimelate--D-alanyl-D-alanine ligase [Xanthobacteraceae bacterium]
MSDRALWTVEAMAAAMGATRAGNLPASVPGLSIDSRTVARGEAFFAITGENRDGHDFVAAALDAGAGLAVVAADRPALLPADAPLLVVPDVLAALVDLARAARARSQARVIAVTGSVGKTGTKDALHLVLAREGETHSSAASYNNHWGVPLSLARMSQSARFGVFEIGMNHAGEITPLTRLVRPHVAIVTAIEPAHLEYFGSVEAIADAKAEIFLGLEQSGVAVINRDSPQFERLKGRAKAAGARVVGFGTRADADARLIEASFKPDCSTVRAEILGADVTYKLGAPGRHVVLNSLAVLAAATLVGADLAVCALALVALAAPVGRGRRSTLALPGGEAILIDESYNANPASLRAALALLGQTPVSSSGRRIAVLGDMLELGTHGPDLHRELVEPVVANAIDLVFCAGPLMHELWQALPSERRGAYAQTAAALEPRVIAAVRAGDAVMIKGSLGSRMGPIVKALEHRYDRHVAGEPASAQG